MRSTGAKHRDAELAEWMTIGYVAQSYHIERDDLARAVGLEPALAGASPCHDATSSRQPWALQRRLHFAGAD